MFPPVATNLGIVLIYTVKNIILSCSLLATNLGIVLIYTVKNIIFFFFQLFLVAPGDVPTQSWEQFCVHLYILYTVWHSIVTLFMVAADTAWELFHTPHSPTGSRTRHLWDYFRQLLILSSIGSGISTGNGHILCMPYSLSLYHVQWGQS